MYLNVDKVQLKNTMQKIKCVCICVSMLMGGGQEEDCGGRFPRRGSRAQEEGWKM